MNIIIEGANFSDSKIGNVNIELNKLTLDYLATTSKVFSDDEKKHINLFFSRIKKSGLLDKMNNLYVPCLAGQLSESMINIANDFSVDAIPDPTRFSISDKGIVNHTPTNDLAGKLLVNLNVTSARHMHLLSYLSEDLVSDIDLKLIRYMSSETRELTLTFVSISDYISPSNAELAMQIKQTALSSSTGTFSDIKVSTLHGLKGFMTNGESDLLTVGDSIIQPRSITNTIPDSAINANINLTGYMNSFMRSPHSIISFGSSLTDLDVLRYTTYCDELMTGLQYI